jgi:ribosome maturation factor RimP
MTDLGLVQQFLGIQIERNRQKRTLRIHQRPYIESILKRFQIDNCNSVSTPIEPNLQLVALDNDYNATPTKRLDY